MSGVAKLFREDVGEFDLSVNVLDRNFLEVLDRLADGVFLEGNVFHALGCCGLTLVHKTLVIVEQGCHVIDVFESEIASTVADIHGVFRELVGCVNLGFERRNTCAFLVLGFPEDGTT